MLLIAERFPVQYHSPVYGEVSKSLPVLEVYASDHSLQVYHDFEFGISIEFGSHFKVGNAIFLQHAKKGQTVDYEKIRGTGIVKYLREVNPLAVLVTGYATRFDRDVIHALKLLPETHIILRAETTDHAVRRGGIKSKLRDLWLRRFYSKVSRFAYIGEQSKLHYLRLGAKEEQLVRSPYCVDTSPFQCTEGDRIKLRSRCRYELGIEDNAHFLLFSGKLSARKGVDLIPEAVRKLQNEGKGNFVIGYMGDGRLRSPLEKACSSEPEVQYRFIGFRSQSQMSPFYHAADALILPSREGETWGLVVNEALHHGLPVIASTAVGSWKDLVIENETGFVFESDSIQSLAQAIYDSKSLSDRPEVRTNCRQTVEQYTVARAAAGIVEAYQGLVGR